MLRQIGVYMYWLLFLLSVAHIFLFLHISSCHLLNFIDDTLFRLWILLSFSEIICFHSSKQLT